MEKRGGEGGGESPGVQNARTLPWGVHVRAIVYQQSDNHIVSTGTGSMERKYAVDDRVDGLTV
jgi:hypothetical protein